MYSMRLKVFDIIDETLALLEKNESFYNDVESDIRVALNDLFENKASMIVGINSRVKSKESLREKIIRNRFYADYDNAQDILDHLSDLIGFIIECRFIEDEYNVLNVIRERMNIRNEEDGYYSSEKHPEFFLDCASRQPQIQKNGFAIYRIDGYFLKDNKKINIELQIKALVNSFWGEIEHKMVLYYNIAYDVKY